MKANRNVSITITTGNRSYQRKYGQEKKMSVISGYVMICVYSEVGIIAVHTGRPWKQNKNSARLVENCVRRVDALVYQWHRKWIAGNFKELYFRKAVVCWPHKRFSTMHKTAKPFQSTAPITRGSKLMWIKQSSWLTTHIIYVHVSVGNKYRVHLYKLIRGISVG